MQLSCYYGILGKLEITGGFLMQKCDFRLATVHYIIITVYNFN